MHPDAKRAWRKVYDDLRDRIDRGDLLPDDTIDSERALAEKHVVARSTVRVALTRLEQEGAITEGEGPFGRKVRAYRPLYWNLSRFELGQRRDDPDTGTDEWAADMREQGREPRQEVTVTKEKASTKIAGHLDVPVKTWLVCRRRLRFADDVLVSIADTWLPEDIAERTCVVNGETIQPFMLEQDIAIPGGIVAAVGIKQVLADDVIMSRMPTRDEAQMLQMNLSGSPVLDHTRVGIDDTGRKIRALISVSPGDRLCLRYRLHYRNGDAP